LVYIFCGHIIYFVVNFSRFWYVEPRKIWHPWCLHIGKGGKMCLNLIVATAAYVRRHGQPDWRSHLSFSSQIKEASSSSVGKNLFCYGTK
jgi:hypothetical protein